MSMCSKDGASISRDIYNFFADIFSRMKICKDGEWRGRERG